MGYPSIQDNNFYEKINQKYKRFKIPKKKKTLEQICFPKKFELQPSQKFLGQYINPKSPYRGQLLYHGIGSGKTCTAITILEGFIAIKNIHVVVPASLIGNFRTELRSQCAGNRYLTENERGKLKQLHPSSDAYKKIIEKSDERIDKYYNIYSFNKFIDYAKKGELNLNNSILAIDEIQGLISSVSNASWYTTLYDTIMSAPTNLKVILLSATPMFDKPVEIALLLNLLRLPMEIPTGREFDEMFISKKKDKKTGEYHYKAKNLDIFKERVKGVISYYKGAPDYSYPHKTVKYVRCEMEEFQYRSYLTVLKSEETQYKKDKNMKQYTAFRKGEIMDLPNNFFIGTRVISNIAFPNKDIGEKGYKSLKGKEMELENLKNYSSKFYAIMKKINRSPGPVLVYSGFLGYGGIKSFVKVLEAHGYLAYSQYGEGYKRYGIISGDEKKDYKEEVRAVMNQPSNANGSKMRVILFSPAGKEGISYKAIRQLHILEPYWNYSRILQIIGRCSRYCSHALLPLEKRNVKVYIYIATHPQQETIDEYIMKLSFRKNKLIEQFELALKESAIDCELFKNANVDKDSGEPDIKCET